MQQLIKRLGSVLCRLMAVLPLPSQLTPQEWREVADVLDGKPVPEERRALLREKFK